MPFVSSDGLPLFGKALYGFDGSVWRPILSDANGRLQVAAGVLDWGIAQRDDTQTTTSTSLVDMPNMSVTVSPDYDGLAVVIGAARVRNNTAGQYVNMVITDGLNNVLSPSMAMRNAAGYDSVLTALWAQAVNAASYTFKLRWQVQSGTGTVIGRSLLALVFNLADV